MEYWDFTLLILPPSLQEFPWALPSGIPSGDGVYLTVCPSSRPNTDAVHYFTVHSIPSLCVLDWEKNNSLITLNFNEEQEEEEEQEMRGERRWPASRRDFESENLDHSDPVSQAENNSRQYCDSDSMTRPVYESGQYCDNDSVTQPVYECGHYCDSDSVSQPVYESGHYCDSDSGISSMYESLNRGGRGVLAGLDTRYQTILYSSSNIFTLVQKSVCILISYSHISWLRLPSYVLNLGGVVIGHLGQNFEFAFGGSCAYYMAKMGPKTPNMWWSISKKVTPPW